MSHSCSLEVTIRIVFGQEDVFHLFCPWILVWDQITGDRRSPTQRSTIIFDSENIFTNWSPANDRKWVVWFMHRSQRPLTIYIDWWMHLYCSIIIWQEGQSMKIVRCFSHLKICTKGLTRILLGAFTLFKVLSIWSTDQAPVAFTLVNLVWTSLESWGVQTKQCWSVKVFLGLWTAVLTSCFTTRSGLRSV